MKKIFQVNGLSALVMYSPNPARHAAFYQKILGIPLEVCDHGGSVGKHYELYYNGIHFAIWKGEPVTEGALSTPYVPTFRINSMKDFLQHLEENQMAPVHKPSSLGEGKLITSLKDPDGNLVRFIQLS